MYKTIIALIFTALVFTLNSMEFEVVDFYEDLDNRFAHSFSKLNAVEESNFFLVVRTNFAVPFTIDGIPEFETLLNYPDTYRFVVNTNQDSLIFSKNKYITKTFRFPNKCRAGSQYILEIESIEAYFLELDLKPFGGKCTINGAEYKYGISTKPGRYEIIYKKQDYQPYKEIIQVDKNNYKFEIALSPIIPSRCIINSKPSDADIFINNIMFGKTPVETELAPGKYLLKLEKKKYHQTEKEIEIIQDSIYTENLLLKPYSFFVSLENRNSVLELKNKSKKIIFTENDSLNFYTDLESGEYNLRVSNEGFSTYKKKIVISDSLIFHQNICLNKKNILWNRDKIAFRRKNHTFSSSKFQTTFHSFKDCKYDLSTGFEFRTFLKRNNLRRIINPFTTISFISLIQNSENKKTILIPIKAGINLNFLGDTKFNIKPEFSLDYILLVDNNNNIFAKNQGISYGLGLEYWLSDNIGINFSYEKSRYLLEDNLELPAITELTSYKTGISYVLSKDSDFLSRKINKNVDEFECGYDELSFIVGCNRKEINTTVIGWEYRPRLENISQNRMLLPLISIKKLNLFGNKTDFEKTHLYVANIGLKLNLLTKKIKFAPFVSFGWAPYSITKNSKFYSNFQPNSFNWDTGFTGSYWVNSYAGITFGANYTTFINFGNYPSKSFDFIRSNELISLKVGIDFRIEKFYKMNRLLNDIDFAFTQSRFIGDFFNENIGFDISKYFDSEKSIIQIIKSSITQLKKDNDIMYITNISYGLGLNFLKNLYYCDLIPFCLAGWEPVMYEFSEMSSNPYNNNEACSGRKLNNFSWNGGVDFKIRLNKIGFKIGYEFTKSFKEISFYPESQNMRTDSEKLKIGFFF